MINYKQTKKLNGDIATDSINRLPDNVTIPFDPANTDYQQYLKWVEAGNQPEPAEEV